MIINSPCECECDCEDEKDAPMSDDDGCCGGNCHCNDDSNENDSCDCGCGHECEHANISPEELEELKKSIIAAGYQIEETPDGEIRILEK